MSKLEDALRVIKETCKSMKNCRECPLRSYNSSMCEVNNRIPGNWKLKDEEPEKVPRLFV